VNLKEVGFVVNYFQTYPGFQFHKTLPEIDVKEVLENKV
jgi:hypothetical protein